MEMVIVASWGDGLVGLVGVYRSLVEEGSSRSRPITGNGIARAGVWSLHCNLVARGESPQLLVGTGLHRRSL
ncbi:hypothetical protein CRG98_033286 [Punica granatum]|uniref:Uncharacterized protein n=1 Tax=Punica granatum TaxID=22663 RepID=A0A2I0IRK7_PUNGR|nr:hypothetical protein CRG98_033286 [Punica granatum]